MGVVTTTNFSYQFYYDPTSCANACSGGKLVTVYSSCKPLIVTCSFYSDPGLQNYAAPGYYSDHKGKCYTVAGSSTPAIPINKIFCATGNNSISSDCSSAGSALFSLLSGYSVDVIPGKSSTYTNTPSSGSYTYSCYLLDGNGGTVQTFTYTQTGSAGTGTWSPTTYTISNTTPNPITYQLSAPLVNCVTYGTGFFNLALNNCTAVTVIPVTPPGGTVPTPLIYWDQGLYPLSGSIIANHGSGGSTYDATAHNSPGVGGTGTASYIALNPGSTSSTQYLKSTGNVIGTDPFSVTILFMVTRWNFGNGSGPRGNLISNVTGPYLSSTNGWQIWQGDGTVYNSGSSNMEGGQYSNGLGAQSTQPTRFNINQWYFYTYTYSGNATGIENEYINGSLVCNNVNPWGQVGDMTSSTPYIWVGNWEMQATSDGIHYTTADFPIGVEINLVRIWNVELTAIQISNDFTAFRSRFGL